MSRPLTLNLIPQIYLARNVMQYDHRVMTRYLLIGDRGKVSTAIKENTIVSDTLNNSKAKDLAKINTTTRT